MSLKSVATRFGPQQTISSLHLYIKISVSFERSEFDLNSI